MLSKPKILSKNKKSSERILNNPIKIATPVSSMTKRDQSSESIVFNKVVSPSIDTNISSVNRTPSTGVTPEIMSTTNSMTPMSIHSKEKFTPIGTKYQSKSKQVDRIVSFLRI